MLFSTALAVTALAGTAFAKDITVGVGKNGLTFEPSEVKAEVGDTVWFKFWPKNHSVAQANFAKPCEPLDGGLWSGFVPTQETAKASSWTFSYNVTNATAPVWFYCSQGQHCQNGMVGVINPPANPNRTLKAFTAAAKEAQANLSPTTTAGEGGTLSNGTTMPPPAQSTGAASALEMSSFAFSGVLGMVAYMFL